MYFAQNGYPNFLQNPQIMRQRPKNPMEAQAAMIKLLMSPQMMKINPRTGTSSKGMIAGIRKYVEACGYSGQIGYQGRAHFTDRSSFIGPNPNLDMIRACLAHPRGAVWLQAGFYNYDSQSRTFVRKKGHWVTLAGYDQQNLYIHNSSPRGETRPENDAVTPVPLPVVGAMGGDYNGPVKNSKGLYGLKSDTLKKDGTDGTILDGAMMMLLNDPQQNQNLAGAGDGRVAAAGGGRVQQQGNR